MRKALALSLLLPGIAQADFIATGPIQGQICSGFIIESCHFTEISAVQEDGRLYNIGRRYPDVSAHDQSKGRCWIDIKSRSAGLLSGIANTLVSVDFQTRNSAGEYQSVDPEYLTFPCIKAP